MLHFLHRKVWKLVEIPEIKKVTSKTIFTNNKSTKFCQTTSHIKRFIHKIKVVLFFPTSRCTLILVYHSNMYMQRNTNSFTSFSGQMIDCTSYAWNSEVQTAAAATTACFMLGLCVFALNIEISGQDALNSGPTYLPCL